jgi:hypothetical protein
MTCTGCIYTRELLKEHDDNTDHGLPKDATSEHVLPRCHLELELGPGPGLVETRMRQYFDLPGTDGVGSDDNPLGLDSGIRRRQLSQAAKTVQAVTVAAPHCQPVIWTHRTDRVNRTNSEDFTAYNVVHDHNA